jgi:hypothetical protein
MKIGTKSILYGAHQFLIHPTCVTLAWRDLYGKWPSWKIFVCTVIHDWGYWGCSDIDGNEGQCHPWFAAKLAATYIDGWDESDPQGSINWGYHDLCLLHSRSVAAHYKTSPSLLCWADKLAVKYDPWWLYLPRVILSGEIHEFRKRAAEFGEVPITASHREWYEWARARMIRKAYARDTRTTYEAGS